MPNVARQYFQAVTVAALIVLVFAFSTTANIGAEIYGELGGVLMFVAFGLVAEALAVDFRIGVPAYAATSSLAFLPFLCALTLFTVPVAVLIIAVVCLVSQFVIRRAEFWKAMFNISQGIIVGFSAGMLYHALVGGGGVEPRHTLFVGAFACLALTFFLLNMLLSSIGLALLRNVPVLAVFNGVVGQGGANLLYDLLASPLALVPVLLYQESAITGMTVILFPLFVIQYSYISRQKVIQQSKDLLRVLVKAIETRDPYTSGHSVRVASLARSIAVDLGLTRRRLNHVEMAALLHDIGKIHAEFVDVLSKPFDLTPVERATIETHAARGAELLQEIPSVPGEVIASVRHHHERYDGEGYPDRLTGTDIPLPARIIMLCDSIDAMLSDRPYRKALSVEAVRDELRRCAGSQFDPDIVQVVIEKDTLERALELIAADDGQVIWGQAIWS